MQYLKKKIAILGFGLESLDLLEWLKTNSKDCSTTIFDQNQDLKKTNDSCSYSLGKDYLKNCPESNEQDYFLSEFHGEKGLSGPKLALQLSDVGFQVKEVTYHWEGMGSPTSFLSSLGLSGILKRRGLAPIVRLIAVKL